MALLLLLLLLLSNNKIYLKGPRSRGYNRNYKNEDKNLQRLDQVRKKLDFNKLVCFYT